MKILFRVDSSFLIGTGHVIRCLVLASELRDIGAECVFLCRAHAGNLINHIESQGFKVISIGHKNQTIKFQPLDESASLYEKWLSVSWEEDAYDCKIELGDNYFDWLVVDHYALDINWESSMRPFAGKILAIDDLQNRHHECDLLLDQNLNSQHELQYHKLTPLNCVRMLGPRYALLQQEYSLLHDKVPPRKGPIHRVLIFFGGADLHNLTGRVLSVFARLNRPNVTVDVVINPQSSYANSIREQAERYSWLTIHENLPTLAFLMAEADLAIGAGGSTSWERCCLGLPSFVITIAENQNAIANELNKFGYIRLAGSEKNLEDADLIEGVEK